MPKLRLRTLKQFGRNPTSVDITYNRGAIKAVLVSTLTFVFSSHQSKPLTPNLHANSRVSG